MSSIPAEIVQAAVDAAAAGGCDVADVSLDAIARQAGISRSTLYRRIGSRAALIAAARAGGVAVAKRPDVRERAVAAAAELIRRGGLGAVTLPAVAAEAGCSLPALHAQLGGREGLLAAVYERYSPLPAVERLLAAAAPSFRQRVHAIYTALFDAAAEHPALLRALIADVLARPDASPARYVTGTYLPRLLDSAGRWLAEEVAAGRCRPLPLPLLLQLLGGPMLLHVITRDAFGRAGGLLPAREAIIDELTEAYCRAVALIPDDQPAPCMASRTGGLDRSRQGG